MTKISLFRVGRGLAPAEKVIGTMWASSPTNFAEILLLLLASFGKGGGFCEAKDGGLKINNNHFSAGVIDYRISGDHTGSFFGRPRGVAPTFNIIGHRRSLSEIPYYEFLRNAEDSVPYGILC